MNAVLQRVHSVTPLSSGSMMMMMYSFYSMLTEDETETVVILTRAVSETSWPIC